MKQQLLFALLLLCFSMQAQEDKMEAAPVPLQIIEKVPIYKGCTGDNTALKQCMSDKINLIIVKKFNTRIAQQVGLEAGTYRFLVQFVINTEGTIERIEAINPPHEAYQDEMERLLKKIPQMEPGTQRGKPVSVRYSLPIAFGVGASKKKKNK